MSGNDVPFGAFRFEPQASDQTPPGGRYSNCKHSPWEAGNLWSQPEGLPLPGGLGSFPPDSAACLLPISGCSNGGRNPCPISASEGRERNRKIQFRVKFCCKRDPQLPQRWGKGDTAGQKSPGRPFFPALLSLHSACTSTSFKLKPQG